jgi:hypothetical protein
MSDEEIVQSQAGTHYTLYSQDGRPLMFHPDTSVLRRSILYVDDETTPIKRGKPSREKRDGLPVPNLSDS